MILYLSGCVIAPAIYLLAVDERAWVEGALVVLLWPIALPLLFWLWAIGWLQPNSALRRRIVKFIGRVRR